MGFELNQHLINHFKITYRVIRMQTDGLSHKESLLQLPFRANRLNWVLGHIIVSRNDLLALLGQDKIWDAATCRIYESDSEPLTAGSKALLLEQLLQDLETTQEKILQALEHPSANEILQQPVQQGERTITVGDQIAFLHFHESYHSGQLEQLRQLAGRNDKVI